MYHQKMRQEPKKSVLLTLCEEKPPEELSPFPYFQNQGPEEEEEEEEYDDDDDDDDDEGDDEDEDDEEEEGDEEEDRLILRKSRRKLSWANHFNP